MRPLILVIFFTFAYNSVALPNDPRIQNPFIDLAPLRIFCLNNPNYVMSPQRLQDQYYLQMIAQVQDHLLKIGLYEKANLSHFRKMQDCPDDSVKVITSAKVALQIREFVKKDGLVLFGDFSLAPQSRATRDAVAQYYKWEKLFAALSQSLFKSGVTAEFETRVKALAFEIRSEAAQRLFSSQPEIFLNLSREISVYEVIIQLAQSIKPDGFATLQNKMKNLRLNLAKIPPEMVDKLSLPDDIKRRTREYGEAYRVYTEAESLLVDQRYAIAHTLQGVFGNFHYDHYFAHTYEAASFIGLMALQELESRYPLNEILSVLNQRLPDFNFAGLQKFRMQALGEGTRDFLISVIGYRPYLHPLARLLIRATLADAQFEPGIAPDGTDIVDYLGLPFILTMQVPTLGHKIVLPHYLAGDPQQPTLNPVQTQILIVENWLRKHGTTDLINWQTEPGIDARLMAIHALEARIRPLIETDCDGWLRRE